MSEGKREDANLLILFVELFDVGITLEESLKIFFAFVFPRREMKERCQTIRKNTINDTFSQNLEQTSTNDRREMFVIIYLRTHLFRRMIRLVEEMDKSQFDSTRSGGRRQDETRRDEKCNHCSSLSCETRKSRSRRCRNLRQVGINRLSMIFRRRINSLVSMSMPRNSFLALVHLRLRLRLPSLQNSSRKLLRQLPLFNDMKIPRRH